MNPFSQKNIIISIRSNWFYKANNICPANTKQEVD
ncbi:hypothetical protein PEDI_39200 [Persicobacter diffluens]|uniref:Uncharacterized protein n=1 Tax=Persicobacter diffluens TaxID=981 RepID=A0AAN4W115_9BACT|nr:hypothetical protein PEDI_39200 [Persicobacter diffluens]